jgi:modulator of FtsH protease HflC
MKYERDEASKMPEEVASIMRVWMVQIVAIVIAFMALESFTYVVLETDRAVVLEWQKPLKEVIDPGLYFKWPYPLQSVAYLPKRYVMWDADPRSVITGDKKTLLIDDFVMVKITDGIKFYQQLRTMPNALTKVDAVAFDMIRSELGKHDLEKIINQERNSIMETVTRETNEGIKAFGMETPLVRITRADLPPENKASVHQRMNAERKRISDGYRAEGQEQNTNKTAETDREVTTIVAKGEQEAQRIMGEGDAEATRIYNAAYGKDPKFFRLYRSLETARLSFTGGGKIQFIETGKEPHLKGLVGDQKD